MNDKKLLKKKYSMMLKRMISITMVITMLFSIVYFPSIQNNKTNDISSNPISKTAAAAEEDEGNDPLYQHNANNIMNVNLDQLGAFSRNAQIYSKYHQNDIIVIKLAVGGNADLAINNFAPLGTAKYPFNGEVRVERGQSNLVLNLDAPLFNYVYDSVNINEGSENYPLHISRVYATGTSSDKKTTPLIANNVIHNDANDTNDNIVTWYIDAAAPTSGGSLQTFGGFIGKMEKNHTGLGEVSPASTGSAKLKVVATMNKSTSDTADVAISGKTNLGLICGEMMENTDLDFSLDTNRNILDISTSTGNVGGLVGLMAPGSKIKYTGSNYQTDSKIISTSNGCAGGIVGYNDGATIEMVLPTNYVYPVKQQIVGTNSEGGVYGYYKTVGTDDIEINTNYYDIDCVLKGSGDVGGLFGKLKSSHNIEINVNGDVSSNHSTTLSDSYGGLIGQYKVDSAVHSLTINGATGKKVSTKNAGTSTFYGGAIGIIHEGDTVTIVDPVTEETTSDGTTTSYVKFDGFVLDTAENAGSLTFGGLVASANNSYIDAEDVTIKVTGTYKGGGLVGSIDHGLLRLSGSTDLTNAKPTDDLSAQEANSVGQIVGFRDDALIYAKSGWTLNRCASIEVDDVGAWGEVVRLDEDTLSGLLTEDDTDHTVTVATASSDISSTCDFAKVALTLQIDASKNKYIVNTSTIASDSNLTLKSDIDLSNTGITGLTRDNELVTNDPKCIYSGTIKSDSTKRTITLAIGEFYGNRNSTEIESSDTNQGNGRIYRHCYNGLIGIADGATIDDINITGSINVKARKDTIYVGAAAATAKNNFTASSLYVTTVIKHAGGSKQSIGGILGEAKNSIGNISVTDCDVECDITGTAYNTAADLYIGGVVGRIAYTDNDEKIWSFSNINVSGEISNTKGVEYNRIGGLIATISPCDVGTGATNRTLSLDTVAVDGLTISASKTNDSSDTTAKDTKSLGGLLGYAWDNVCVTFDSVTVENSTLSLSNIASNYGDMAGLVYEGTGYWVLDEAGDVTINNITVSATGGKSFGMFVNKAWHEAPSTSGSSALYLEVQDTEAYVITNENNDKLPVFEVYDEFAAYSAYYNQDGITRRMAPKDDIDNLYVLQNGNAVISIKTDVTKGLNMDNGTAASNSYTPQTTRGSFLNPYTRYYYNLDYVFSSDNSAPANLMRWGVNQYAHDSIKNYLPIGGSFTENSIPSGTYNMQGYSWYPVDIDHGVTVNGTFKFYNKEFEGSEAVTVSGHTIRSSLDNVSTGAGKTQHYLLQNGLFRNVNSNCTLNIGTVTLQGNVGVTSYGSGALICGRVQGAQDKNAVVNVTGGISLAALYVHDISGDTDYAPLLINKIGSYSKLDIYNVTNNNTYSISTNSILKKPSNYPGVLLDNGQPKAGTSLIGNVGGTDAKGVIINFRSIKLDGRKTGSNIRSGSDETVEYKTNSDLRYLTNCSIFSKAIFLNKFQYASGSYAKYDFTWFEDWEEDPNDENGKSFRKVTYGKELGYEATSTGNEYPGEEQQYKYTGDTDVDGLFVNPADDEDTSGWYAEYFISDFLPYVATPYNKSQGIHQIIVNHNTVTLDGCGTYNDPYVISNQDHLVTISQILYDGTYPSSFTLPTNSSGVFQPNATWHSNDNEFTWVEASEAVIDPDTEAIITPAVEEGYYYGSNMVTKAQLRTYVAGAYYMLSDEVDNLIINSGNFVGLGNTDKDGEAAAVFRGVIEGNGKVITNRTIYPLIVNSNGSVIKSLELRVEPSSNISVKGDNKAFDQSSNSAGAYGAIIAKVLGGDNIIDDVLVRYDTMSSSRKINVNNKPQLAPVGGYVGVILNGGVIFRNISTNRQQAIKTYGLKASNISATNKPNNTLPNPSFDSKAWLYINPIIGRVINGYAVTEADAYHPFEDGTREYGDGTIEYWQPDGTVITKTKAQLDAMTSAQKTDLENSAVGVTLTNGTKHYSITDIDNSSTGILTVAGNTNGKLVTPTNSQAFFIMSLIANSGMGILSSATDTNPSEQLGYYKDYQTARHADYSKVGTAKSADNTSEDYADYNIAKNDLYWSISTKANYAPYIITKYSVSNAKALCGNASNSNNNRKIALSSGKSYYLPDGYKGIGNMYADNSKYRITVTNFEGNGATISMNSSYYYYYSQKDKNKDGSINYDNDLFDSAYKHRNNVGFGLFNNQYGLTNNISSSRYYNFTLTGNVICDCIDNKSGEHIKYYANDTTSNGGADTGIDRWQMVSAGMLMGTSNKNQILDSVAVVNINVKGVRNAGGLIGWVAGAKNSIITTTYNNSLSNASERIKVHSGASAGGMIGRSQNGKIDIDNNNATYSITEVVSDCEKRDGHDYNYGVGGFIGFCRTDGNLTNSNEYFVRIRRVIVGDKNATKATIVKCNEDCIGGLITGGLIGMQNKATLSLDNCKVYNQSVTSPYVAGGLLGYIASTTTNANTYESTATNNTLGTRINTSFITNTEVYSNSSAKATVTCTGMASYVIDSNGNITKTFHVGAGGFIGAMKHEMANVAIQNSSISGYHIYAKEIAGGIVGIFGLYPSDGGTNHHNDLRIENFKISDCEIKTTENGSIDYAGGLVGIVYNNKHSNNGYRKKYINGYNIIEKNLTIDATKKGYICGWRNSDHNANQTDSFCVIKIAGFSRQDDRQGGNNKMFAELVGDCPNVSNNPTFDDLYGIGGYVIFADYRDEASASSPNKSFSAVSENNVTTMRSVTTYTANNSMVYGDYDTDAAANTEAGHTVTGGVSKNENFPYVTSNPAQNIDATQYLTGDAMGTIVFDDTSYNKIITDTTAKKYTFYSLMTDNLKKTIKDSFSSTHKEFINLVSGVEDFPVLVVEDTVDDNITAMINGYIRVLTNTQYNFAKEGGVSGVYSVELSKWEYNGTKFVKSNNAANLLINNNKFHIDGINFDTSDTPTFTLIDVQFFDPSDTSNSPKVAYHLYVPVYVKKLLQYSFYASFASNTDYYKTDSSYQLTKVDGKQYFNNNKYFENLGNPFTLGFEYVYHRSGAEWKTALEGGENVLSESNFYKSIIITRLKANEFPENLKLVLVDSTKNGKNYYLDTVTNTNDIAFELDLKDFKTESNEYYKPSHFNDLLTIKMEISDSVNGMFVETNANDATFRDENGAFFRRKESTDTTGPYYNIKSVVADSERYYLSFFTKKLPGPGETGYNKTQYEKIYYYQIKTKDKFDRTGTDGNASILNDWRPNKCIVNQSPILLLGNLYETTFTMEVNSKENNALMTNSNNYISVKMTSTIELTDVAKDPENQIYAAFDLDESVNETANISQMFLMTYSMKEKDKAEQVGVLSTLGSLENKAYYYKPNKLTSQQFDVAIEKITDPNATNAEKAISIMGEAGTDFIPTPNYVEMPNSLNLVDYLADGDNGYAVTLRASFDYLYDSSALSKQFPNKDETSDEDIGTKVIGYSNISSSRESAAYSATSKKLDDVIDNHGYRYYTQGTSNSATLTYNMYEDTVIDSSLSVDERAEALAKARADGIFRDLGINAKDQIKGHILSRADYDTHVLTTQGDYIELTLTLSKKSHYIHPTVGNPIPEDDYGFELEIKDYLKGLKIYGKTLNDVLFDQDVILDTEHIFAPPTGVTATMNAEGTIYTVRVPVSLVETLGEESDGRYVFRIEYDVLTGDGADRWNKEYSNYKVSLTAAMYENANDASNNYMKNSYAFDHLIYTNAKIQYEVIGH